MSQLPSPAPAPATAQPPSSLHVVRFADQLIRTTVTTEAAVVEAWLREAAASFQRKPAVIGVGCETRPYAPYEPPNKVAVLQLCAGEKCLVIQLLFLNRMPPSLLAFLDHPNIAFVGVEITNCAPHLLRDHGLRVRNKVDLVELESIAECHPLSVDAGCHLLSMLDGCEAADTGKQILCRLSNWQKRVLSPHQIEYATVQPYICHELAHLLAMKSKSLSPNLFTPSPQQ